VDSEQLVVDEEVSLCGLTNAARQAREADLEEDRKVLKAKSAKVEYRAQVLNPASYIQIISCSCQNGFSSPSYCAFSFI
jgi:hypothetical protein